MVARPCAPCQILLLDRDVSDLFKAPVSDLRLGAIEHLVDAILVPHMAVPIAAGHPDHVGMLNSQNKFDALFIG